MRPWTSSLPSELQFSCLLSGTHAYFSRAFRGSRMITLEELASSLGVLDPRPAVCLVPHPYVRKQGQSLHLHTQSEPRKERNARPCNSRGSSCLCLSSFQCSLSSRRGPHANTRCSRERLGSSDVNYHVLWISFLRGKKLDSGKWGRFCRTR